MSPSCSTAVTHRIEVTVEPTSSRNAIRRASVSSGATRSRSTISGHIVDADGAAFAISPTRTGGSRRGVGPGVVGGTADDPAGEAFRVRLRLPAHHAERHDGRGISAWSARTGRPSWSPSPRSRSTRAREAGAGIRAATRPWRLRAHPQRASTSRKGMEGNLQANDDVMRMKAFAGTRRWRQFNVLQRSNRPAIIMARSGETITHGQLQADATGRASARAAGRDVQIVSRCHAKPSAPTSNVGWWCCLVSTT